MIGDDNDGKGQPRGGASSIGATPPPIGVPPRRVGPAAGCTREPKWAVAKTLMYHVPRFCSGMGGKLGRRRMKKGENRNGEELHQVCRFAGYTDFFLSLCLHVLSDSGCRPCLEPLPPPTWLHPRQSVVSPSQHHVPPDNIERPSSLGLPGPEELSKVSRKVR